jgi:hypothetical protein
MGDLFRLLSGWRGRSLVQEQLEARGFIIPSEYQRLVAAQCSEASRLDLQLYWDEAAREYVCSAGQADSATRSFPDVLCYRSGYLDRLAAVRGPTTILGVAALHPCLNEFATKRRTDPDLDAGMIRKLEADKRVEARQHGILVDEWSGEKSDIAQIFARLMQAKGFRKHKKSFIKEGARGLVFGGFADTGGRPYSIVVPFHFFISADVRSLEAFEISFERVTPGFWFYYRFDSIETALLGFLAHVEMIDIIANAFGDTQ